MSFCIPESFNTNILNQFFDNKITKIKFKSDFVLKNGYKRSFSRYLVYKNKSDSDLVC